MQKAHAEKENFKSNQKNLITQNLELKLQNLKSLNLQSATVNIWVAKTKTKNLKKRFSEIKRLNIHRDYRPEFKKYVTDCIESYEHISELKPITTIQDNRFFYIESSATDLSQLKESVESGGIKTILNESELNSFNSYAIQLTFNEPENSLFAFSYIAGSWSLSQTSGKFLRPQLINNNLVVKIDTAQKFLITPRIDFIQYNNDIFIANLNNFELAMNYHERLKEKKTEAIISLCDSPAISQKYKDTLTSIIGNDKNLMRQLASVHSKEYYTNEIWLRKLKQAADQAGNWQIAFDENGMIIIKNDKNYIKEVLTLLQNKRVKTIVDGMIFDVDGELVAVQTKKSQ